MFALISEFELSRTHGTGVQMLRAFEGSEFFHLHWYSHSGRPSESANSAWLRSPKEWPFRIGRGFLHRLRNKAEVGWWPSGRLNEARLKRLLVRKRWTSDVAYVVVSGGEGAHRASSILRCLGVPYVVHVMDLADAAGKLAGIPSLKALVDNSFAVLALNEEIATELSTFNHPRLHTLPFMHGDAPGTDQTREELLIISGSLGPHGVNENAIGVGRALAGLKRRYPQLQAVYFGSRSRDLPEVLRTNIDDLGYISDEKCREMLGRAKVACLVTPNGESTFDRYSIPSRIADYFAAGIPVVAWISEGNATSRLLNDDRLGTAAQLIADEVSFTDAVEALLTDHSRWHEASTLAQEFAAQEFAPERVTSRLHSYLDEARNYRAKSNNPSSRRVTAV